MEHLLISSIVYIKSNAKKFLAHFVDASSSVLYDSLKILILQALYIDIVTELANGDKCVHFIIFPHLKAIVGSILSKAYTVKSRL